MGQKIHPGGMRVGVIHDWKSNWYTGKKEFPQYLIEDIKIREHITKKLSHAGLSDILIRKDKQRITIDIFTARPGIVIGKSGVEVDALRKDLHALTAQERPHQHQRDQAPGARREARRAVDRRAAAEPRLVPSRDEARARLGHPLRRAGDQDRLRRPARRRRDEPLGDVLRGPRAAAHDPRRHRLRLHRGEDDLRPDRRQGLDQQGRDHAGGLRGRRPPATSGSATRIRRAGGAAARRRASAPRARARAAAARTARASGPCASGAAARAAAAEPAEARGRPGGARRSGGGGATRPHARRRDADADASRARGRAGRRARGRGRSSRPSRSTPPPLPRNRGVRASAAAQEIEVPPRPPRPPQRASPRASPTCSSASGASRPWTAAGSPTARSRLPGSR